jgi:hypothetical protein
LISSDPVVCVPVCEWTRLWKRSEASMIAWNVGFGADDEDFDGLR